MDESEIQSINRRDVLLLAAAAGATLSVPSLVLAGGSKASPPAHSGDPSMGPLRLKPNGPTPSLTL